MRTARLKDGTTLNFPDNTPDEVIQAAVRRHLGQGPGPIPQPTPAEVRHPGIGESFIKRGLDVMGGAVDLGIDAAKSAVGGPLEQAKFLPRLAGGVYGGMVEGGAQAAARQFSNGVTAKTPTSEFVRAGMAAMPVVGPYVMNAVSDVEAGDAEKVVGEKLFDASTLGASKLGRLARPAESVAGGSETIALAERLGIKPRRAWLGLRDKLAHDPLADAGGNQAAILKKSIAEVNPELESLGAAPVADVQNIESLRRAVRSNMAEASAREAERIANQKSGLLDRAGGLRQKADLEAVNAESWAAASDALLSRIRNVRGLAEADKNPLMTAPTPPNIAARVGAPIDPADAGELVARRVREGKIAATSTLGKNLEDARAPFLNEPMPAEELAKIAGEYGQHFPGVTDATGRLLFDEGAGLNYGAVNALKQKLGYAASDKNKAAGALSRKLNDRSLEILKERGLDVSGVRSAENAYREGVGNLYDRGRPGSVLKAASKGNAASAISIPLNEGRAWEQLVTSLDDPVKHGGGAGAFTAGAQSREALIRNVVHNNMGLSKGLETFTEKWRSASPRMKTAVFGPAETRAIDSILQDYGAAGKQFERSQDWANTRAGIRGRSVQGVEENVKALRDKAASASKETRERLLAEARDLESQARELSPSTIEETPKMRQLREVWDQYAPAKNLADSPFNPTTKYGIARLLHMLIPRQGGRALRIGLSRATRAGDVAMLYNLVAKQTRLERRHPSPEVPTFEQFSEKEQQQ